jgi:hypothetical protein
MPAVIHAGGAYAPIGPPLQTMMEAIQHADDMLFDWGPSVPNGTQTEGELERCLTLWNLARMMRLALDRVLLGEFRKS